MAQPRAQSKQSSSANPRVTNTLPATRDRRGSLVPKELRSWAASPFSMLPRLSDDMDQLKAARWSAKLVMPVMPGRDHMRGLPSAAVTLLEYGDYECPRCRAAHGIVTTIRAQLRNRLCHVYRHFPLATAHPHAQEAAEAAEAAASQNKFWEMHDALFSVAAPLSSNLLRGAAVSLGLNIPLFHYELSQHAHLPRIREDFICGARSGVSGTPTIYINEVRYDGEWNLTSVANAVNSAIGA